MGQKAGVAITRFGKDGFQAGHADNDGMAGAITTRLKAADRTWCTPPGPSST
ncbi:hypothetical protein [Kitasatospora sp. NPDC057500]|uniref:hypothetical protein n=1 Tax=Kitasatospora sp. NPDC057500 TaxID=3346151 RepID=UPI0036B5FF0B